MAAELLLTQRVPLLPVLCCAVLSCAVLARVPPQPTAAAGGAAPRACRGSEAAHSAPALPELSFACPAPGCGATFAAAASLDAHYRAAHRNACGRCGRVLPTARLLELHVQEAHDAFFAAMAARGRSVFRCLVDGCGEAFASAAERGAHAREAHLYAAEAVAAFEATTRAPRTKRGGGARRGGRNAGHGADRPSLGGRGGGRGRGRGGRSLRGAGSSAGPQRQETSASMDEG